MSEQRPESPAAYVGKGRPVAQVKAACTPDEVLRRQITAFAFTDALHTLEKLGHPDAADQLRERWREATVAAP